MQFATIFQRKLTLFTFELLLIQTMNFIKKNVITLMKLGPEVDELVTEYYKALVASPFRNELEEKWGSQLFDLADFQIKGFSSEVISFNAKGK